GPRRRGGGGGAACRAAPPPRAAAGGRPRDHAHDRHRGLRRPQGRPHRPALPARRALGARHGPARDPPAGPAGVRWAAAVAAVLLAVVWGASASPAPPPPDVASLDPRALVIRDVAPSPDIRALARHPPGARAPAR